MIFLMRDGTKPDMPFSATSSRPKPYVLAVLLMALLAPVYVLAQIQWEAREIAQLPAYCKSNQALSKTGDPAEVERWKSALGDAYKAIHHYCWAQLATNRAKLARTPQDRLSWLNHSIQDFEYVLNYSPRDFVLLPELLTKEGENLIEIGSASRAIPKLEMAIEVKPDYWPPYVVMSDYYKKLGDLKKAKEWLDKGLSSSPDSKTLQSRLAELNAPQSKAKAPAQPEAVKPPANR